MLVSILLSGLLIVADVLLVIHVFRTGQDRIWIYLLIFLPYAGIIAYLLIVVLPQLFDRERRLRLRQGLEKVVDPGKRLRELEEKLALTNTFANRKELADAQLLAGNYPKAVELYEACNQGIYRNDPIVLAGLAEALFLAGDLSRANEVFRSLENLPGVLVGVSTRLMHARCLESAAEFEAAETEYRNLVAGGAGFEAKLRFGVFLKNRGRPEEAIPMFEELLRLWKLSPPYIRKAEARWMTEAGKELKDLSAAGKSRSSGL